MILNNQSGITYYRQVADIIIARIYKGIYSPGEQLPTGRELSHEFDCNRHTIRRALDLVEAEKLIARHQGRGTFVLENLPRTSPKIQFALGLIDISRQLGTRPNAQVLNVVVQPAEKFAPVLGIPEHDKVIHIHRLRLLDGDPIIVEYIYIPLQLAANLMDFDLSQSLRQLMQTEFQLQIIRSEITFEPILSSPYVSDLLQSPVGSPMMVERRLSFNTDDVACEYSEHIYRGDRFSFTLK
jgi:GntR family transcriptional regulator